jgi:hypothetical protein
LESVEWNASEFRKIGRDSEKGKRRRTGRRADDALLRAVLAAPVTRPGTYEWRKTG